MMNSDETSDMMTPNEAIISNPSQVWLTSYYGFTPEDWGFFSFTDKGRMETVVSQTRPGFLVVIYGAKSSNTPEDQKGKVIGLYQCSHNVGIAGDFCSALGMENKRKNQNSENQWNHGIQAVRAWRVVPESYPDIELFAPNSYSADSGTAISRYGVQLDREDAKNILKLDLVECDVFGSELNGAPLLGSAEEVFGNPTAICTPSKAGPVSRSPFVTRESEGPKHLYVLELTGPVEALFVEKVGPRRIIKVGFSKSPLMRCGQFNSSLPVCKLRWKVLHSTLADKEGPYPSSKHARAGEDAIKVLLDRQGCSLGGEFFSATLEAISEAWESGRKTAKEFDK